MFQTYEMEAEYSNSSILRFSFCHSCFGLFPTWLLSPPGTFQMRQTLFRFGSVVKLFPFSVCFYDLASAQGVLF